MKFKLTSPNPMRRASRRLRTAHLIQDEMRLRRAPHKVTKRPITSREIVRHFACEDMWRVNVACAAKGSITFHTTNSRMELSRAVAVARAWLAPDPTIAPIIAMDRSGRCAVRCGTGYITILPIVDLV